MERGRSLEMGRRAVVSSFLGKERVPLKGFLFPLPPRDPNLWTVKCKVRAVALGLGEVGMGETACQGDCLLWVSLACQFLGPSVSSVLLMGVPMPPASPPRHHLLLPPSLPPFPSTTLPFLMSSPLCLLLLILSCLSFCPTDCPFGCCPAHLFHGLPCLPSSSRSVSLLPDWGGTSHRHLLDAKVHCLPVHRHSKWGSQEAWG